MRDQHVKLALGRLYRAKLNESDHREHGEHPDESHDTSIRMIAGTLYQGVQQPHRQRIGIEAPIPLAEPDCSRDEVPCDYFRSDVHANAILSRGIEGRSQPPAR